MDGPILSLRGTFPVRGATPLADACSRVALVPARPWTSSAPSGHLPRARGRLRFVRSYILPKTTSPCLLPAGRRGTAPAVEEVLGRAAFKRNKWQALSSVVARREKGDRASGGRGPWASGAHGLVSGWRADTRCRNCPRPRCSRGPGGTAGRWPSGYIRRAAVPRGRPCGSRYPRAQDT